VLGYALVSGFAEGDRALALARLTHAACEVGGTIVDFGFYADEGVRLSIELPSAALPRLRDALEVEHVHLFEQTLREIDGMDLGSPDKPVLALVHVTLLGSRAPLGH
jgi:hypothetical protein